MFDILATRFWNFILTANHRLALGAAIGAAVVLRLPTIFMDYIHVDVNTTYLIVKRELMGLPFAPNKNWLNHDLFRWSVQLFGDSPTSFHFTGILFIAGTCLFVYLLAKKIYGEREGIIAALLYGCVISSYNTEFMATNGEVLYNLFNLAAYYFFFMVWFQKKYRYVPAVLIALALGYGIKLQGLYAMPAILFFLVFVDPGFRLERYRAAYYRIMIGIMIVALVYIVIDWNFLHMVFTGAIRDAVSPMVTYVMTRGFNPFVIIGKLIIRAVHFGLYHGLIWIPGIYLIYTFCKNQQGRDRAGAYIITLTLLLFASIFLGGSRLSPHYFIPVLPLIAIVSGREIIRIIQTPKTRRRAFVWLIAPTLFFFGWNLKDAYIANCNPSLKYSESRCMYYFRMVMLASHGEYLLPDKDMLPVIDFLKKKTGPHDTLHVFPMGTELTYFSGKVPASSGFWHNEGALHAIVRREAGDWRTYRETQLAYIDEIRRLKPDYIVDISRLPMIRKIMPYKKKGDPAFTVDFNAVPVVRFGRTADLDDFPELVGFLNREYSFAGNFGLSRVWKKKTAEAMEHVRK